MDTGSLMYRVENVSVYDRMQEDADLFDTSDNPKDHILYSGKN